MILNNNIDNDLLRGLKINDCACIDYVKDNVVYLRDLKHNTNSALTLQDKNLCKINKMVPHPIIKYDNLIIINPSRNNMDFTCIKYISSQGLWLNPKFSGKYVLNNLNVVDCYTFGIEPMNDCIFKLNNCNIETHHYVVECTWRGTDRKLTITKNNSKIIPKCVFFMHDNDCAFERINNLVEDINENLKILGLEHIDLDMLNCILIPNKYYNKIGVLYKKNSMFEYSFDNNQLIEIYAENNFKSDWKFREFSFKKTYLDEMSQYSERNIYLKWIEDLII